MNASLSSFSRRGRTLGMAALFSLPLLGSAQTALYQWNFNAGTGAATGSAGGGTLTANGSATFAGTGITGGADKALSLSNAYTGGTGSGNSASSVSGLNLGTVSKFTITMWVNLTSGDLGNTFARLIQVGAVTNPDTSTIPGINMSLNNGGIQIGVSNNNFTQTSANLTALSSNVGNWVFLAFAYDGTSSTAYNSTTNSAAGFGSTNNAALLLGTTGSAASVVYNPGIATSASSFVNGPGSIALGSTATAYLGNNPGGARGLTGLMDDVRIYGNVLTVAQINAIRVEGATSAIPEPSTYAGILGGLVLASVAARRRRA